MVTEVNASGVTARQFATAEAIIDAAASEMKSGDVVAILSNGGFGGIYAKLPARLKALNGV